MKSFKAIQGKKFSNKTRQNREGKKFKNFSILKEISCVDPISVKFSSKNNHRGIYLASSNLYFFDLMSDKVVTNYPLLGSELASADIRSDGKVLSVGTIHGNLKVYEPEKKINITSYDKSFKTRINCIDTLDNKLLACSNDLTVKYFSLDRPDPLLNFSKNFSDYIISCKFISSDIFVAGGLDKKLKLFDIRSGKMERSIITSNNQGIADIQYRDNKIYLACDNQISSIDLSSFTEIENNTPMQSSIKKIILTDNRIFSVSSAGENFVAISDYESLKKLYIVKLGAEIIDFDITYSKNKYAMVDIKGKVEIKQKDESGVNQINKNQLLDENDEFSALNPENYATKNISKNYKYFNRGQYLKDNTEENDEALIVVADTTKKQKLQQHDIFMKKFMYKEALDSVLMMNNPELVFSLLEELIRNNAFHIAILKREPEELLELLKFISWKIQDIRYQSLLINVYSCLVNYYYPAICLSSHNSEESRIALDLFVEINQKIKTEIQLQKRLLKLEEKIKTSIELNSIVEINN